MQLLPEISVSVLSKYILYLATPCYLVYNLPSSISPETLGAYWHFPLVAIVLLVISDTFAYIASCLWARPGEKATFRILVGLPNWVFMALAVCEPLFRQEGVRVVLLFNVGITFYFWTFGMTSFRPAVGWRAVLRQLFVNPQTVALGIGFALAMLFPLLGNMEKLDAETLAALPFSIGIITPVWETVYLLGGTALPLSIVQIGLLLGEPRHGIRDGDGRSLVLTSALRLLAAPLLALAALTALRLLGTPLTRNEFVIAAIIFSMPAAVTSLTITDLYGGATRLAAKGILTMTLASLLTVPLITWLTQKAYALFFV